MRYLKFVFLTTIFAAIALVVSADTVDAAEIVLNSPESVHGAQNNERVNFTATLTLDSNDPQLTSVVFTLQTSNLTVLGLTVPVIDNTAILSHFLYISSSEIASCISPAGAIPLTLSASIPNSSGNFASQPFGIPCSVLVTPPDLTAIEQETVCGSNNDVIHGLDIQLTNISLNGGSWENGLRTVSISANTGYSFEKGTLSQTIALPTFIDQGIPCIAEAPVSPSQSEVCGFEKDELILQNQPTGVNPVPNDTGWKEGVRTITYLPAFDYIFPENTTTAFEFTDSGRCEVEPNPPTQTTVCGVDNDLVTIPDQPTGVIVTSDGAWTDGEWSVTYTAPENYKLPDDETSTYTLIDSGPCVTELPVPPVVTEVCGPNNDVVLLDDNQPVNVVTESDGEWSEGTWNITFSAAENYVLPDGATAIYNLEDRNTPCPTDAPVPPVQTAICGPNNDLLTFPDQPEGVTLNTDTDWEDNERTVTFAISDAFTTDGPTTFTFEDDDDPCPVIPIGKKVTVILNPSDGGSLEGGSFALYATTASQTPQPAYIEGVVGADNTIVFEELMPGHYRLTVDAEGYEPIDELLMIGDGGEPETITIQVTALQILPTPTPEPTVEPTPEPTVAPTVEPTVAPTAEPTRAPVSDLPSTGSGSTGGTLVAGFALIAAAMLGAAVFVNRKSHA